MAEGVVGRNLKFPIFNSDGTPFNDLVLHKATYDSVVMSLGDKITGDVYYRGTDLAVTMGEYVEYDGVKFVLVSPPVIVREGMVSDNSELKGLTKYSFTFYHPMYMLANFPFSDVAVSNDQKKYLSENKSFSWIGNLTDFVAKINKNLDNTQWYCDISLDVQQSDREKLSEVMSFDNESIADAIKRGYETWKFPYIIDSIKSTDTRYSTQYAQGKRFLIQFGLPTRQIVKNSSTFIFEYGQGVGLKNNSRTPRNNKIITRIAGYGSEDNIPYGYPQIQWYGNQSWDYTVNNNPSAANSYPIYDGIVGGQRVRLIKHPFTRTHLMPTIYATTLFNKISPYLANGNANPNYDPTLELVDYYDADNTYANPIVADSPSYEIHEFEDIKPELQSRQISSVGTYDNKYLESVTMSDFLDLLEDFITQSQFDEEKEQFEDIKNGIGSHDSDSGSVTPSIYSVAARQYSCKWSYYKDDYYAYVKYESNGQNFEYIVRLSDAMPTPAWDDTMDDDGNYVQSYFTLTLPALGFDLYACAAITQEMSINMRSGDCLGCTFPVMVDWDDYKKNFYDDEGNFDPVIGTGHPRDAQKYPNSTSSAITVVVQKDLNTFGTLMPNIYQKPAANDDFVILGISLPQSYITNAQTRLEQDMKQYMRDNNVHYYDYPLKFDEYFLANNTDILQQMRPNVVVKFKYNGTTLALYIKQFTVKFGDKPLPEYNITLTDDVEIVLNDIGKVSEEVSNLRILMGEGGDGSMLNDKRYLRKDKDDVAAGIIKFIRGLQVGESFVTGLLGEGGIFRKDADGTTYLECDKMYVRMKAYFDTVEVRKYLHSGGNRIASPAGVKCTRVEWLTSGGVVTDNINNASKFRCYFRGNDDGVEVTNDFVVGDQAFCQESNVNTSAVNMRRYWRLVINKSSATNANGEHWIDLSNYRNQDGTPSNMTWTNSRGETVNHLSHQLGSDVPVAQDDIIQLGNADDSTRQGAIIEYVTGNDAPSYQIYQGIDSFSLEDKNYVRFGYDSESGGAQAFIGNPDESTYLWYHNVTKNGVTRPVLEIKAVIEASSPIAGTDKTIGSELSDLWNKVDDLQNQIDGAIETYFFDYMPVAENEGAPVDETPILFVTVGGQTVPCQPYYDWFVADGGDPTTTPITQPTSTTERTRHLGDMFYDNSTGYAFRFSRDGNNGDFEWVEITDSAVIEALRKASEAFNLADTKNKVFITSAGHLPPYPWKEGDLWVNATYPSDGSTYSNDILKCTHDRTTNGSISDWTLASKYTDDTLVEHYMDILAGGSSPSRLDKEAALASERAIRNALGGKTIIDGGLMLTSIIGLRQLNSGGDPDDPLDYTTWGGMSGEYDSDARGNGIAAWYGGNMLDKESLSDTQIADGWNGNQYHLRWARGIDRFDGSGYRADGNISWAADGTLTVKGHEVSTTTLILNGVEVRLSDYLPRSAGASNPLMGDLYAENIVPKANAFTTAQTHYYNLGSQSSFWQYLFVKRIYLYKPNANNDTGAVYIEYNTTSGSEGVHVYGAGFYTESYLSALGINNSGGGGGGGIGDVTWEALASNSDTNPIALSHIQTALSNGGYATQLWVQNRGYLTSHQTIYALTLQGDGTTVSTFTPNSAALTFNIKASQRTAITRDTNEITIDLATVSITAPAQGDTTYTKVYVDAYGRVTKATTLAAADIPELAASKITSGTLNADRIPELPWSRITTGKPTSWWGQNTINNDGSVKGAIEKATSIEFDEIGASAGHGGFLDFHFNGKVTQNNSNVDYTSRIIEDSEGVIKVNNILWAKLSTAINIGTSTFDTNNTYKLNVNGYTKTTRLYLADGVYFEYDNNGGVQLYGAGFWTNSFLSALGRNSGGSATIDLAEPLASINSANLGAPTVSGQTLVWTGSAWVYSMNTTIRAAALTTTGAITAYGNVTSQSGGFVVSGKDNTYVLLAGGGTAALSSISVAAATTSALGTVKVANQYGQAATIQTIGTGSNRNYGLQIDTNGLAFVNVPWENTDTQNTAGSDDYSTGKLFIIGAPSQTTNNGSIRTWSNSNCYVLNGYLYSGGSKVLTEAVTGFLPVRNPSGYDADTIYNTVYNAIYDGTNTPTGYGVLMTLSYRNLTGNTSPDYSSQIFIAAGNEAYPYLYYRTSHSTTWDSWRTVLDSDNYSSYALPLTGGTLTGNLTLYATGNNDTPSIVFQRGEIGGSAWDWRILNSSGTLYFQINKGSSWENYAYINGDNNKIYANGFAKIGGTSSQFLKADGSVDSNTYLTSTLKATTNTLGMIKVGSTLNTNPSMITTYGSDTRNYGVLLTSDGKAFVHVPWVDGSTKTGTGVTQSASQFYLVGAVNSERSSNGGETYTQDNCYMKSGFLYSGGSKVLTEAATGFLPVRNPSGYDADTIYDTVYNPVYNGSNVPGGGYGVLLTLSYRNLTGNTTPDYASQIYIKAGNENSPFMCYRTSHSTTWDSWRAILDSDNYSSYALPLSAGSSYPLTGNLFISSSYIKRNAIDNPHGDLIIGRLSNSDDGIFYNSANDCWLRFQSQSSIVFYAGATGATGYAGNSEMCLFLSKTNQRIGIKTSSPQYNLHVAGTFYASGDSAFGGTLSMAGNIRPTVTGQYSLGTSDYKFNALYISGNGYIGSALGVGRNPDGYQLDVIGQLRLKNNTSHTSLFTMGCFTDTNNPFIRFKDTNGTDYDIKVTSVTSGSSTVNVFQLGNHYAQTRILGSNVRLYARTDSSATTYSLALTTMYGGRVFVGSSTSVASDYTDYKLVVDGGLASHANSYLNGSVGIGVAPSSTFALKSQGHVFLCSGTDNQLTVGSDGRQSGYTLYVARNSSGNSAILDGDVKLVRYVGINANPTSSYYLYVNGTSYFNGLSIGNTGSGSGIADYILLDASVSSKTIYLKGASGAPIYGSSSYSNQSDIRLKNIVSYVDESVERIANAPIFNFVFKDAKVQNVMLGTSAQYWMAVLPSAVTVAPNSYLSMDYGSTALAAAVITARKVVDHEKRIRLLEVENEALRREIDQLKNAA